ncbi:hypothetical protein DTO027B5_926 [Paecilomyces variotii]|nr:hypothetical protein DTO027B3_1116 [Paecilomyces variotii]KAJ9337128.1 hypothetical protein DTO027B5_926 [Paecilomyces variotii]
MLGHLALSIVIFCLADLISPVLADVEAYYQSDNYENGEFGEWPQQTYHSSHIIGPVVDFLQRSNRCDDGQYTMLSLRGGQVPSPGPMILDAKGNLVWRAEDYVQPYGLSKYTYKGEDYLTFWAGNDAIGHGEGMYYMLDSSYEEAFTIGAANGLRGDLHEFHITHDETALVTIYEVVQANLTSMYGPVKGWIWDGVFQELNIETGEALFQWRASEHFDFTEGYVARVGSGSKDRPWDFFHINSVDKDSKGNYLISSRYMSCIAYIDGKTGDVIWKLGGKKNMFKDLSGGAATNIRWQHHARFADNGTAITLFDNASRGPADPEHISRGLYLDVDQEKMTVNVRHEYWNPHNLSSQSQGSLQLLDSGNILIGYGSNPAWTEFSVDGEVLCDVHFGPQLGFGTSEVTSYRVLKHSWVGFPKTDPDITLQGNTTYVSWNGATEVVTWVLEGADSKAADEDEYLTIDSRPKEGFETEIPIPPDNVHRFIRISALDAKGITLGSTLSVEWDPSQNITTNGLDIQVTNTKWLVFFSTAFSTTIFLVIAWWASMRLLDRFQRAKKQKKKVSRGGIEDFIANEEFIDEVEFSLLHNADFHYNIDPLSEPQ